MTDAIPHVLAVVEPTADERPAVMRAAWLAKLFRTSLELFICESNPALTGDETLMQQTLEEDLGLLASIAASMAHMDITITTDARCDRWLDDGVLRKVVEAQPFLVVKDTYSPALMRQALFSNTDWNLLRSCPAPLLLAKPRAWQPRRVIAAVDPVHDHDKPAELDRRILDLARDLCRVSGAELHVAHFFDPVRRMPPSRAATGQVASELVWPAERQHRDALHALLRRCSLETGATVHFGAGDPRERLPALVEQVDAGFMVLGAVARGPADSGVIGTTAEYVLERLPCDVVVVKPPNFPTPAGVTAQGLALRQV